VGDSPSARAWPRPALRHRLRRNPLDDAGSSVRVERAVAELMWPAAGLATQPRARDAKADARRPDDALAAALLAVDPAGLGGAALRGARPAPARDDWLALLRQPAAAPTPLAPAAAEHRRYRLAGRA